MRDPALAELEKAGHHFKYNTPLHRRCFEDARKDYLRELRSQLQSKFAEVPVLASLYRMLTPSLFNGLQANSLDEQLAKDFDTVAAHFCQPLPGEQEPRLNRADLEREWVHVRKSVFAARERTKAVTKRVADDNHDQLRARSSTPRESSFVRGNITSTIASDTDDDSDAYGDSDGELSGPTEPETDSFGQSGATRNRKKYKINIFRLS